MHRPVMSGPGLYDPTTIMNADELSRAMKEGWCKLAFYLLSFFYYLYRLVNEFGTRFAHYIDQINYVIKDLI